MSSPQRTVALDRTTRGGPRMQGRPGTWADVKVGRHIRSKDGVVYKVAANGNGHWGLVDRDGNEKIIPEPSANAPVTIMYLTQDELEEMIAEQLGGHVHAVKRPEDTVWISRPFDDLQLDEMI